jgi:autotransporter-associated beta strand protein
MAGDFDPRYNGYELFTFVEGLYNVSGIVTSTGTPGSYPNFRIWWDGDLGSENLDNLGFTKWDYINNWEVRLYTARNVLQLARNTPAFYGDILGDWREEAIYESSDHNYLTIFTSPYFTTHRIYTLAHNPGYRNDMAVRGYYQSHNTDFYLGYGMQQPPIPPIQDANAYWVGNTAVWDKALANWSDGTAPKTFADGDTIMFDIRGKSADTIQLNTTAAPGKIWAMNPDGRDYYISGNGKLTGAMELWKTGAGSFTLAGEHDYTGHTIITEGLVNIDGSLQSKVIVKALGAIGGRGHLYGGLSLDKGANSKGGRIHVGFGATGEQPGTLTIHGDLNVTGNNNLEFDVVPGSAQINDSLVITGDLVINGINPLTVSFANDNYLPGTYTLISCKGTLTASLNNFVLIGVAGVDRELVIENNEVKLRINPARDPGSIVWSGAVNALWDFKNTNFRLHDTATAFVSKDTITFDSTALHTTVELNETVFPSAITFNSTVDYALQGAGSISGTTGIVKTNTNNLTILSTGNTYTGKTIVNGGTLTVTKLGLKNEPSSIGAANETAVNLQISNARLVINERSTTDRAMTITDTATITIPQASSYAILMGNITGTGALVKDGPGAIYMIGAKNFAGPVIIRSGTINLRTKAGNERGLGTSNNITIENATLSMEDVRDYAQAYWNMTVPPGKSATFNTDGRSTLRGALNGAGILTVNIPYVRTDFRGDWSQFTGKINITQGDFRIGNTFGYANAAIHLAGGYIYTISGAAAAVAIGELSGAAGTTLSSDVSNASWIIGAKNTDATFGGNIHKGALIKTGTGTFTVTGNNVYANNTTINAGRLLVNNSAAGSYGLGKGQVTVAGGGVLGGTGSVKGAITVQDGGSIQPGSNGIGFLTDSTSVTFLPGAIAEMEINKGTATFDVLKVTAAVQFNGKLVIKKTDNTPFAGGDQFRLFEAGTYSGNFTAIEPAVPGEGMVWIFNATTGVLSVKQTQTITFNPLAEKGYGDADFDAGATASSRLPVVYASSNPEVADVVNGIIQIKTLGSTLISAAQSGNEQYEPAETVTQLLVVKDKQAPTEPLSLTAKRLADHKVGLLWLPSTDDIGVTGYYVFLNGQALNTTPVTTTSYVADAPRGGWNHVYTVRAVDSAGNVSGLSNPADIYVSAGEILSSLKVFPNPTHGNCWLWFISQQTGAVKIDIYNSNGVNVQTVNDIKSGYFYQRVFDLSSMTKGMYLIRVTMASTVQTKIVLVQ